MYASSTTRSTRPQTRASIVRSNSTSRNSTATRLNHEWDEKRWEAAVWVGSSPPADALFQSIRLDPDRTLHDLITAFQQGHSLAGRVILQALLPKLILLSRQHPYPSIDDLVAALWIRISAYRLDRRPLSVAANLVLDARKDSVDQVRATRPFEQRQEEPGPTARDVLAVARLLGLASPLSLSIVECVYVLGMRSGDVAELHSMTPAAVRRRCSDTIRQLRLHKHLLVEMLD